MVELTVALPMFNAKHIGWLSLESLTRQEDIDFEWELVVAEEQNNKMMSREEISTYSSLLKKVNCVRIGYIPLHNWIPLSQKWKLLGEKCANTSKVFLMAGADNYMNNKRLNIEYNLIANENSDWGCSDKLPFYIIKTEEVFIVDYKKLIKTDAAKAGMTFSTKTEYIKRLPLSFRKVGIDGWLFREVKHIVLKNKEHFKIAVDNSNWIKGFGTHGLNNISSVKRYDMLKKECVLHNELKDLWPKEVMDRLISLKTISTV